MGVLEKLRGLLPTLEGVQVETIHASATPVFLRTREDEVNFLQSGAGALFLVRSGYPDVALSLLRPGDLFGEERLFSESRFQVAAGLLTTSTIFRIPKNALLDKCKESPECALALAQLSTRRQQQWAIRIESILREPVGPRLIRALLELDEVFSGAYSYDGSRRIPLTQATLAVLVGVTRESVSSKLNELERMGLVRLGRGSIEVVAPARLRQFTVPLPEPGRNDGSGD
jgi:CRP/FNR family transcriptional regulator